MVDGGSISITEAAREGRHIRPAERAVLRALGVADFLSLEPAALT